MTIFQFFAVENVVCKRTAKLLRRGWGNREIATRKNLYSCWQELENK